MVKLDFVSTIITFARTLGSFVCFQWEEATFSVGGEYFPVCSGCFGIYLGSTIALSLMPHYEKISKKLFSIKYGLPMILPLTLYWIILNVQNNTGIWVVPAIKELYSFFGILFGVIIANTAYNLGRETSHATKISTIGKHFWILTAALLTAILITSISYGTQRLVAFAASLVFMLGLLGLAGFIVAWIFASVLSPNKEKLNSTKKSTTFLTVLTIFASFLVFQALLFENTAEAIAVGLFFGIFALGLFAHTLRTFNWRDLGITIADWKRQLVYGVIIGCGLYLVFLAYHFIFSGFDEVVVLTSLDILGVFTVFAVVVSEELFFRGYMITMFERQIGTELSCLASSILFTIYHYAEAIKNLIGLSDGQVYFEYEYLITLFLGGLLLAFLFTRKRSLIMPIVVHFTWNMLIIAVTPQ